jgi:cytochrome d ubiquinol oxidase subunit I
MDLDTQTLSRVQFALTIMFHYLFPPLSIGLATMLVYMEGMYLRTKDPEYQAMAKFWTGILAVNFAVGVATGLVMQFQFGTNWSRYARYVGDVFGSALAAEGIFAFFLESGFLAVLVFGWDRVSPKMHFFSTCMVMLGSTFSAVWIVIANSWQQTPAGSRIGADAFGRPRAEIVDFWAVVFNPSSMDRLTHVILGAWILGAFFVMSVTAYYILRGRHVTFARKGFVVALVLAGVTLVAMGVSGDSQARKLAYTQPAKLAAFEGHFHQENPAGGTPMTLVGWPNVKEQKMEYNVAVPGLLSWLVYFDANKPVKAWDQFRPEDRPPVVVPFAAYHIMVGVYGIMLGMVALAWFFWWRGTLFEKKWLLVAFVPAVVLPYIANETGWVAAETGRQPFVVYGATKEVAPGQYAIEGGMRTADAYSPNVKPYEVLTTIVMFSLVYVLLFGVWVYVLNRKIQHGPEAVTAPQETTTEGLFDAVSRRGSATPYRMAEAEE